MFLAYKYRVKDKHAKALNRMDRAPTNAKPVYYGIAELHDAIASAPRENS